MLSIKTLAMATALSAGVVFAMPVSSQAMPVSSPVKVHAVNDGNIVNVNHRKHWKRWVRYCGYNDWRCRRHHHYAYRYYYYEEPYYGYYEPYYYYRPHYYRPGVGLYFGIH